MFAQGVAGTLRLAHYTAADLGPWTMHLLRDGRGADRWVIHADIARPDEFWLGKDGPWEVRIRLGRTLWVWRGVAVARRGDHLTIEGQGGPEERIA